MKNKLLYFCLIAILYSQITGANPLCPDYKSIVPAYIASLRSHVSDEEMLNEKILARYFLALHLPSLSQQLHAKNAAIALVESLGVQLPPLSHTSRAILNVALQKSLELLKNEVHIEYAEELLSRVYFEFGPVPQQALDDIKNRIMFFDSLR